MEHELSDAEAVEIMKSAGAWSMIKKACRRPDFLGRITTGILGHVWQDKVMFWAKSEALEVDDVSEEQTATDLTISHVPTQAKVTSNKTTLNLMRNGHNERYEADEFMALACGNIHDEVPIIIPAIELIDPANPKYLLKSIRFENYETYRGDTSFFRNPNNQAEAVERRRRRAESEMSLRDQKKALKRGVESGDVFPLDDVTIQPESTEEV